MCYWLALGYISILDQSAFACHRSKPVDHVIEVCKIMCVVFSPYRYFMSFGHSYQYLLYTHVICFLIWLCDIAVCITYLISHSLSLSLKYSNFKRIFEVECIINSKLPSCVDVIHRTLLGFPSWCPESTCPTDLCFQGTSCENLMMYGGLYQHTRVVLYMYIIF